MNFREKLQLEENTERCQALEAEIAALRATLEAMAPTGPGRKPGWLYVLRGEEPPTYKPKLASTNEGST